MIKLVLYGTIGCHLCDDALIIVHSCENQFPLSLNQIDIADDESLYEQYGLVIPVLMKEHSNDKLYWPFDSNQVAAFLANT